MSGWDPNVPSGDAYDWASFTIPNATTNYDLKANQSALWKNLSQAKGIVIIADQNFSIRINATTYPAISVTTAQNPWEFVNKKIVRNAFITNNSGATMNIEVFLL